uniref:FAD/NAD(P)-binding domain-containing protein n=1 Tax=Polytomella parva TaxID=51329 RepID=A0A7S0Y9J5_9CHLO|mmetsp:Transcript_11142/g.20147  ORF Transcript_11142/g.20147 Transcript_11142/m.20147 type:complete len:377 (+) Transcript_11142:36-1166(+)|eukprot:CAMPEP_0175064828 /NCGR_PEP_ID=MMETSP0052_2-20121109/15564_1 /TAXON_ID=51329 ORGANISM="Polytomella parva, Strain SAG 63-3" /NCGR_SAMPLE_ID=MMETSP0052_2 /ASSEMBLY_ACC=CAM_ASM_000194 /LENGTH=376 /DNA_ID=CAMNT_0016331251 /DNA_START=12 /DNA_END=1142 /DNA_ORIENTATION=-
MPKRIVIVGGGIGGVTLASKLSKSCDVTLIDRHNYVELTWATVRGIVNADFAKRISFAYNAIPNLGKFVQGNVSNITSSAVILDDGSQYSYDFLVISVGASYPDPAFRSLAPGRKERLEELKALGERIKAAKRILIVGGGPTGVEAAGEILDAYAGKELTLVHSGSQLIDGKAPKLANYANQWMKSHGATIVLNSKVQKKDEGTSPDGPITVSLVPSEGGEQGGSDSKLLTADLALWCVGNRANTGFLKSSILSDAIDPNTGLLRVLPTLQIQGHINAFAVGDCCDACEVKLAFLAGMQAETAARNLIALTAGKNASNQWKPGMMKDMMMVTLGSGDGFGHMGGCLLTGRLPSMMKSRTLFVDKYRSQFGVPANYE